MPEVGPQSFPQDPLASHLLQDCLEDSNSRRSEVLCAFSGAEVKRNVCYEKLRKVAVIEGGVSTRLKVG
jgi:hypothetical protein